MTDDLILLASAYLDGEATPDERALVEADPSLLEEVERLRTARIALLDAAGFERPGDDAREAAIAAALTAWDFAAFEPTGSTAGASPTGSSPTGSSVSSVSSGPTVVPFVRRHSYSTRWLTAAAAVAAVAALGVVVAQFGSGDGDDNSAASDAATADTELSAESRTEFEQIEPPAGTQGALFSGDDAADEAAPEAAAQAPSADIAGAGDTPSAAPEATSTLESAAVPEASLGSPEELGVFAAEAKTADEDGVERDTLARPCPDEAFDEIDTYVAVGTYLGRPVVVGIDDERGRAFAVDPDMCEIVAEAPLP
jgi:hypothetical protein